MNILIDWQFYGFCLWVGLIVLWALFEYRNIKTWNFFIWFNKWVHEACGWEE